MDVKEYIQSTYHADPRARTPLKTVYHRFLRALPQRERRLWPRWRLVRALQDTGYQVGVDGSSVSHVAGISETAPKVWAADESGRLVLA